MKWLLVALSILIKSFVHPEGPSINPKEEFKKLIKENTLKIFLTIAAAVAIGTLFTSGVILSVLSFSAQIDAGAQPKLTAILASGLCIIFVCISLFSLGIYNSNAKRRKRKKEIYAEQTSSMQDALMILINDFIKERELKRTHQSQFSDNTNDQREDNYQKSAHH